MISILLGLVGALIGVGLFVGGFFIGYWEKSEAYEPEDVQPIREEPELSTEDEERRIAEERQRLREDQKAFHDLLGYNADVAYGVSKREG